MLRALCIARLLVAVLFVSYVAAVAVSDHTLRHGDRGYVATRTDARAGEVLLVTSLDGRVTALDPNTGGLLVSPAPLA